MGLITLSVIVVQLMAQQRAPYRDRWGDVSFFVKTSRFSNIRGKGFLLHPYFGGCSSRCLPRAMCLCIRRWFLSFDSGVWPNGFVTLLWWVMIKTQVATTVGRPYSQPRPVWKPLLFEPILSFAPQFAVLLSMSKDTTTRTEVRKTFIEEFYPHGFLAA